MNEQFILCQDDLGNYEIRYGDKVFHFLWEVAPILNEQQVTIQFLKEENEQLKKSEKINMEYAEQIVAENKKLRITKNDLRIENEQLKKYCTVLKNQIKTMGEIGGFNKHMIKTILESNYDD